jgi:hypothetical protein
MSPTWSWASKFLSQEPGLGLALDIFLLVRTSEPRTFFMPENNKEYQHGLARQLSLPHR